MLFLGLLDDCLNMGSPISIAQNKASENDAIKCSNVNMHQNSNRIEGLLTICVSGNTEHIARATSVLEL